MGQETIDRGELERVFGKTGAQYLQETADCTLAGKSIYLEIQDASLIDPALEVIKKLAKISPYLEEGIEPKLVVFDFRKQSADDILGLIKQKYRKRGPEFKSEHKGEVFVAIEPKSLYEGPGAWDVSQLASIVKWAPTIVICRSDPKYDYGQRIFDMIGAYTDLTFKITAQPSSK